MIDGIQTVKLTLDDSRRLTGKGLLWDHTGAILDAFISRINKKEFIIVWKDYTRSLLNAVGWEDEQTSWRIFEDGVSLAISAPIDLLYSAVELNETAWKLTCQKFDPSLDKLDFDKEITSLKQLIADESNPKLVKLVKEAYRKDIPCLYDDDTFSLGYGPSVKTWPVDQLPDIKSIDWSVFKTIPIAIVTGTNGKSTSVRLLAQIFTFSGKSCGVTSTDFIRVGDTIIEKGDYSGPGGARILLRDRRTQAAVLEIARGGLLRRGLPIPKADTALITNVAEDHLGQYGINTLDALTQAKFIVTKSVKNGILVLNADDEQIVRFSNNLKQQVIYWFSRDKNNPRIQDQIINQNACAYVTEQQLILFDGAKEFVLCKVKEAPMTFNGAAKHNISNALGSILTAFAHHLPLDAIQQALISFKSDAADNPGRANIFFVNGAKLIVDFAHNEHSMLAMAAMVKNMPSKRKWLMLSHAGDRSNAQIESLTNAALSMQPDCIVVNELPEYLRGRKKGEVSSEILKVLNKNVFNKNNIWEANNTLNGVKLLVDHLQQGDLALIMVLDQRESVFEYLNQIQNL
jgi:cyanophycin synthetase